jgi:hypothetical protein
VAVVGAIAVAGVLAGIFYMKGEAEKAQAGLNPDTFCPVDGPTSETAVLVDRTDGLNAKQAEAVVRMINQWAEAVPPGGLFRVYEVGQGNDILKPRVDICNPGTGEGASSLTANPKLLMEQYEKNYQDRIRSMAEEMRKDAESDTSPVMEAVQSIVVTDFGRDHTRLQDKNFYLISDLLQHVPQFSLYKGVPKLDDFLATPYARTVNTDLNGIRVNFYMLNRDKASNKQVPSLRPFWAEWFSYQNATLREDGLVPG